MELHTALFLIFYGLDPGFAYDYLVNCGYCIMMCIFMGSLFYFLIHEH